MSNLKPGTEPAKNLYQAPEIEELILDASNAFLEAIASGEDWTVYED